LPAVRFNDSSGRREAKAASTQHWPSVHRELVERQENEGLIFL
jgi:hypothetical protein